MRYFLIFSLGTIVAICVASLLSWQIYQLSNLDSYIAFSRFAKISIILLIIAFTVSIIRILRLPYRKVFGLENLSNTSLSQSFILSLGSGLLIVIPLIIFFIVLDIRTIDDKHLIWSTISFSVVKYFATALLIAIIEEIFFRGALIYGLLKQKTLAILLSAGVFAILHFIAFDDANPSVAPWYYGIQSLYDGIIQRYNTHDFLAPITALFIAGIFLASVRISTQHIIGCIGIHCGWVMGVKLSKKLTDTNQESNLIYLVSDYNHFIGWASAIWFGLFAILWLVRSNHSPKPY